MAAFPARSPVTIGLSEGGRRRQPCHASQILDDRFIPKLRPVVNRPAVDRSCHIGKVARQEPNALVDKGARLHSCQSRTLEG
jgi:hypothetical protein